MFCWCIYIFKHIYYYNIKLTIMETSNFNILHFYFLFTNNEKKNYYFPFMILITHIF